MPTPRKIKLKTEISNGTHGNARNNWKKLFAVKSFLTLAKSQSSRTPAELIVGGKYRVGKKIANGAFGQLRMSRNLETGEDVAIKLEASNAKMPMLFLEYRFYKAIGAEVGFPKVLYYGTCGKYNALVMDLLGPNLEQLFMANEKVFSLKTVLLIAIQLLKRIEHIHSVNLIYRDIKPENCLIGRFGDGRSIIHMVDFGLAKPYADVETGRHIAYSENKNLTGTVRYMSINAHQGKEQSRRDDLQSLGYVFYYFLSGGKLPWQGVKCESIRKRYQIIGHIKGDTKIGVLASGHPWEFAVYMRYCCNLKFSQTPDYGYLRGLFRGCLKRYRLEEDNVFDWNVPTPISRPTPGGNALAEKKNEAKLPERPKTVDCSKRLKHIEIKPRPQSETEDHPICRNGVVSAPGTEKKSKEVEEVGSQETVTLPPVKPAESPKEKLKERLGKIRWKSLPSLMNDDQDFSQKNDGSPGKQERLPAIKLSSESHLKAKRNTKHPPLGIKKEDIWAIGIKSPTAEYQLNDTQNRSNDQTPKSSEGKTVEIISHLPEDTKYRPAVKITFAKEEEEEEEIALNGTAKKASAKPVVLRRQNFVSDMLEDEFANCSKNALKVAPLLKTSVSDRGNQKFGDPLSNYIAAGDDKEVEVALPDNNACCPFFKIVKRTILDL